MTYKQQFADKYDIPLIAKFVYYTGAARLYDAGINSKGGYAYPIFRKWHPVAWLVVLIALIPCALAGEKLFELVPFDMSDYYKENLKWVGWRDFK